MRAALAAAAALCAAAGASAETAAIKARRAQRHMEHQRLVARKEEDQRAWDRFKRSLNEEEICETHSKECRMPDVAPPIGPDPPLYSNLTVVVDLRDTAGAEGGSVGSSSGAMGVEWKQGNSRVELKHGLMLESVGRDGPGRKAGLSAFIGRYLEKVNGKHAPGHISGLENELRELGKTFIVLTFVEVWRTHSLSWKRR